LDYLNYLKYFHKDWLEFEKEGTPQNLFPRDED
jgi:hypothetical protein